MKTPMQQLFEEMTEKGFFIAEYIKRPALEREKEYAMHNYWEGYKEGQHSGDTTAEEFYNKELARYNVGTREWPIKRDYPIATPEQDLLFGEEDTDPIEAARLKGYGEGYQEGMYDAENK